MNPHSITKKRELGAYYTPSALSQILADWAITNPCENILEPSFGGCGFFESSINRLIKLGSTTPEKQLYGVDIDPHAFDILSQKFNKLVNTEKRFLLEDFITVKPEDFLVPKFNVILGNPPYVSMHNMTYGQRESCDRILKETPFSSSTMGRNASLWAFFLLHSLSFLSEGGKVAWVLPSSLMHADYAKKLIEIHQKHFSAVKVLKLAERFFKSEGAKETSVILIADQFHSEPNNSGTLSVHALENLQELRGTISDNCITEQNTGDMNSYKLQLLPYKVSKAYLELANSEKAFELNHFLDLKIGMVTGANKYFVVDKETVEKNNLTSDYLLPVIGKFSSFIGLKHTKIRQKKIQEQGYKAYLINPTEAQLEMPNSAVKAYLNLITDEERAKNRTFKKRKYWFAPNDGIISDGFLSYMLDRGPQMVINQGKVNCTNSIHKVFFNEKLSSKKKLAIAVTLLSTFTQFSAEIEGRAYSSGVLKIEPSAGKKLKILLNDRCIDALNAAIPYIEKEMEKGNYTEATSIVDSILVANGLISQDQSNRLLEGVHFLRQERYKGV